jgi:hypothetical protein
MGVQHQMSDHVAATSQKELAPVNTALVLTTSLCTGGLTVLSELLGKSIDRYALYILVAVWLLAILICIALIGRVADKSPGGTEINWLSRWSACTQRGLTRVTTSWAYSLLLLAMATLGGTSYVNFKRAHAATAISQGRPAGDGEIWMALAEGNVKTIEIEKSAGREDFKYTNPLMGNALESLVIKGGQDAFKTLELVPPLPTDLNRAFKASPQYNYSKIFPKAWGEDIYTSLGIQVVDRLPGSLNAGTVYIERDREIVSNFHTTPLMLAIWSQDMAMLQKLLSLGADAAIPTTFQIINVKVKPQKSSHMAYEMNSVEVTLLPSSEAKRIGGAVAAAFSSSTSNQTSSSIRLLR